MPFTMLGTQIAARTVLLNNDLPSASDTLSCNTVTFGQNSGISFDFTGIAYDLTVNTVNSATWTTIGYGSVESEADAKSARDMADKKAEALLLEHLAEEQRKEMQEKRRFRVILRDGREFVVEKGSQQNVYLLDKDGKKSMRYCLTPAEKLPDYDAMLAQKFMLECDPVSFEKVAVKTPMRDGMVLRDGVNDLPEIDAMIGEIIAARRATDALTVQMGDLAHSMHAMIDQIDPATVSAAA